MDIHPEHVRIEPEGKPQLIIPALLWLLTIILMIGGALILTSCASTFQGMCAMKRLGVDEHGNTVALVYCEAKE